MVPFVKRGVNNIYTVSSLEGEKLCRIKGKQLQGLVNEYNPIAVGDRVEMTDDGMIERRLERKSWFGRWNVKGLSNQCVAANMDQVAIMTSPSSPPFRPRFIDRAIACVRGASVLLLMNKCDILLGEEEEARFSLYAALGYATLRISARTGEGMDALLPLLKGKITALVGQSGVGKSTLVNRLSGTSQRTGEISGKWRRGCHTTSCSLFIECDGFSLIDTPGVRELYPPHGNPREITESFPEFREPGKLCAYPLCLHEKESGCRVKELVESGEIDGDRYESYLRMLESEREMSPSWLKREKKLPKKGLKYKDHDGESE